MAGGFWEPIPVFPLEAVVPCLLSQCPTWLYRTQLPWIIIVGSVHKHTHSHNTHIHTHIHTSTSSMRLSSRILRTEIISHFLTPEWGAQLSQFALDWRASTFSVETRKIPGPIRKSWLPCSRVSWSQGIERELRTHNPSTLALKLIAAPSLRRRLMEWMYTQAVKHCCSHSGFWGFLSKSWIFSGKAPLSKH